MALKALKKKWLADVQGGQQADLQRPAGHPGPAAALAQLAPLQHQQPAAPAAPEATAQQRQQQQQQQPPAAGLPPVEPPAARPAPARTGSDFPPRKQQQRQGQGPGGAAAGGGGDAQRPSPPGLQTQASFKKRPLDGGGPKPGANGAAGAKKRREDMPRSASDLGPAGATAAPWPAAATAPRPGGGASRQRPEKQQSSKDVSGAAGKGGSAKKPAPQAPEAAAVGQRAEASSAPPRVKQESRLQPAGRQQEKAAAAVPEGRPETARAPKQRAPAAIKQDRKEAPAARQGGAEGSGSAQIGIPLELMPAAGSNSGTEHLGEVVLSLFSSHMELSAALRSSHGARLPPRMRIAYRDAAGDWMLLQPDVPWGLAAANATQLLLVPLPAAPAAEAAAPLPAAPEAAAPPAAA
eukprot:scaffold18.g1910.t1